MKKSVLAMVVAVLVAGFAVIANAGENTGALSGTVVISETGAPVEGALVFVRICEEGEGGLQGTKIYSDTTDEFGQFFIAEIPAGEWTSIARKRAAGRDEEIVAIEAGAETVVGFELLPAGGGVMMRLHEHQDE